MDKYFLSQKSLSPSPISYQKGGSNPQQSQFTFKKNKIPPGPIHTDIDDRSMRHASELSIYNTLFSTRSQNPKQDFSSVEIHEEDPINDEPEQAYQNNSVHKQIKGPNSRVNPQQSSGRLPSEHVSKHVVAPSFGAASIQERKQRIGKLQPQTYEQYEHYGNDKLNTEHYDFDLSDKLNFNPTHSVAYTGAMKALQNKIKHLENKMHHVINENQEMKQLLQFETEKAEQIEQEYEEYKGIESQIRQQLESMEAESKGLAEALEHAQNERQVLEVNFTRLKEENISLLDENGTANKQIKDNSKLLQELLANEKNAQAELKISIEFLKREKEELQKKNEDLQSRCAKTETELAENKKIYKDHLQELVVKNETITHQLESTKDFYGNQISDFQRELSNIEEINNAKLNELEKDKQVLEEKLKDTEQTVETKNREIEELKQSLARFMNHVLETEKVVNKSIEHSQENQPDSPGMARFSKTPHRGTLQEQNRVQGPNRVSVPRFTTTTRKNLQFNSSVLEPTEEVEEQFNVAPPLSMRTTHSRNDQNFIASGIGSNSMHKQSLKQQNQYDYGLTERPETKYKSPMQNNRSSSALKLNGMVGNTQGYYTERPSFEQQESYDRFSADGRQFFDRGDVGNTSTNPNQYRDGHDGSRSVYQRGIGGNIPELNDRNSLQANFLSAPMRSLSFGKKDSEGQDQKDIFIQAALDLERDPNRISRFKQSMNSKNPQGNLSIPNNVGNNQDYLEIIENIVSTEKEIENLNFEYKETLDKAQVN